MAISPSPDEIRGYFGRSDPAEWPTLARRIIRASEPYLAERMENQRTRQAIFEAFDPIDFELWHRFHNHERKMA